MEAKSYHEVLDICTNLMHDNYDKDYAILRMIILFMCEFGIKNKEIPVIKIKDVMTQNENISSFIKIKKWFEEEVVFISIPVRNELKDYLEYLKHYYDIKPESKLFPGYNNVQTVYRHLKQVTGSRKPLQRLKKEVMKRSVNNWLEIGSDPLIARKLIAQKFRVTKREIYDVIRDKIQPAGNRRVPCQH